MMDMCNQNLSIWQTTYYMGERLSLEKTVFVFRYWFDMNSVQGLQRRMVLVDSFSNFLNYHFVALF